MEGTKGERREQKRKKAWYKRHLANNRKALELIRQTRYSTKTLEV